MPATIKMASNMAYKKIFIERIVLYDKEFIKLSSYMSYGCLAPVLKTLPVAYQLRFIMYNSPHVSNHQCPFSCGGSRSFCEGGRAWRCSRLVATCITCSFQ